MKKPKADMFLWHSLMTFGLIVVFVGCFTERKAKKQLDNIADRYPDVFVEEAVKLYPKKTLADTVIDFSFDSTIYNTLQSERKQYELSSTERDKMIDSLNGRLSYWSDNRIKYCEDCLLIKEGLEAENEYLIKRNITLEKKAAQVKTITIPPYEDSAKIKVAQLKMNEAITARLKADQKAAVAEEDATKWRNKNKGGFTIKVHWWQLLLLGAILGLMGTAFVKRGSFNPLKLIGKPK